MQIYIGRDPGLDSIVAEARSQAGMNLEVGLTKKGLQNISASFSRIQQQRFDYRNFHSFHAWSPGSSHSKILLLVYPTFLRIVITSCNMMDTDTVCYAPGYLNPNS
jgi:tyrosyl-DNA phosphodiesterase-1